MRRSTPTTRALALVALMSLGGCCPPSNHLLLHQKSVIGIDISPSPETGEISLTLGYDRKTAAFIPRHEKKSEKEVDKQNPPNATSTAGSTSASGASESTEEPDSEWADEPGKKSTDPKKPDTPANEDEAMSTVAMTKVVVPWLGIPTIIERMATGTAAIALVQDPKALRAMAGQPEPKKDKEADTKEAKK